MRRVALVNIINSINGTPLSRMKSIDDATSRILNTVKTQHLYKRNNCQHLMGVSGLCALFNGLISVSLDNNIYSAIIIAPPLVSAIYCAYRVDHHAKLINNIDKVLE